jgi:hypothetical protein
LEVTFLKKDPRRKKLFIYKPIQGELFRIIFWSNFLTSVVFVLATIGFVYTVQNISEQTDSNYLTGTLQSLSKFYWIYFIYLFAGLMFCMGLITYSWLKVTHTVAGPLFQIRSKLESYIESGEFKNIQLREKDKLHEIAELINKAVALSQKQETENKN